MTDISLEQFEQLFDKKLSEFKEHVDEGIAQLGEDNRQTNKRIDALGKQMEEGFAKAATIDQIDAIAKHLAQTNATVGEINDTLKHQAESLDAISRRLDADLDRLDDQGKRIEKLEAAAGLPSPPTGS